MSGKVSNEKFVNSCLANSPSVYIQLFRKRLSEKVHATIPIGIVGGFEITVLHRNFERMAREAMDVCFRVLKRSSKSRFRQLQCQKQCIDHIPYYLSGLSRALFSDNLSRLAVYTVIRTL